MPLGSVYAVGIRSGHVKKVVGGLFAPVGIAVGANGDIFVSQLFGGEISRIKHGTRKVRTFAKTNCRPRWSGPRGASTRPSTCWSAPPRRLPTHRRAASW